MTLWYCQRHGLGDGGCCDHSVLTRTMESTQGLDEETLRHLQLAEIREMLNLPPQATHFAVLSAIHSLYTGVAPAMPARYRNHITVRSGKGPGDDGSTT